MKLLSDLYNVTLKRGIRGAAKGGFVRPTIGQNFMTHRDFVEIVSTTVPGPPTVGTVTVEGFTASVQFTAPVNDGGATITQYIATSTPGGITGTLNQAGSGTITVTGLSIGVSYTFKVRAINSIGSGPESSASNSVNASLSIGQFFEGGYYFGDITVGTKTYGLLCSPTVGGQTYVSYKTVSDGTTGTKSFVDGVSNTNACIAAGATAHPAANFCRGRTIGGYTDWYLPARNELWLLYQNRSLIQAAGAGSFASGYYWASTEKIDAGNASYRLYWPNPIDATGLKHRTHYVRAIRRFQK